ncbi:cytochrome c biogenesis CcdA family protein [Actinophytocola sp. NPDC049390]|uniref:cytochrome c biogenesis CcdA family protein n=1 Tax=Actinophytocola sp. NPDC049390 TaxID=3363894 RepID=UPI0037A4C47F
MDDLLFALTAGMLATVNPCGFAMLPGYLTMVVAGNDDATRVARVGRALAAGALMTAGFVAVFGIFGLLSLPLRGVLQQYLPIVTMVIGVVMVVVGVLLLAGRQLTLLLPKPARGAPSTRLVSMAGYGVAFAIASLSCTIGPFLAATGIALRGGDLTTGLTTFVAYALGMGLVVAVLAVAAALASTAVASGVRRVLPYVPRIGGVLLLATGAYVGYYGFYELRLFHGGGDAADPVVGAARAVQSTLVEWVDAIGPLPLVVVLVVLVAGGVLLTRGRRARAERPRSRRA